MLTRPAPDKLLLLSKHGCQVAVKQSPNEHVIVFTLDKVRAAGGDKGAGSAALQPWEFGAMEALLVFASRSDDGVASDGKTPRRERRNRSEGRPSVSSSYKHLVF